MRVVDYKYVKYYKKKYVIFNLDNTNKIYTF